MPIDLNDEIVQDFLIEAGEILERLGEELVELESQPDNDALLNSVFRGFHTIKGGAGFIGATAVVDVCHRAEDTFNLLRQGERRVDAELMDTMLAVLDVLNAAFDAMRSGSDPAPASAELLSDLDKLSTPASTAEPSDPLSSQDQSPEQFDDLLSSLDEAETTSPNPPQTAGDEAITENEFEDLLDNLHWSRRRAGKAAAWFRRAQPHRTSLKTSSRNCSTNCTVMGKAPGSLPRKRRAPPSSPLLAHLPPSLPRSPRRPRRRRLTPPCGSTPQCSIAL